jgi:hypothetical protein
MFGGTSLYTRYPFIHGMKGAIGQLVVNLAPPLEVRTSAMGAGQEQKNAAVSVGSIHKHYDKILIKL